MPEGKEVKEFVFGIPECDPGDLLRIKAPDGIILKIPLPENLRPGDALRMHRPEGGEWTVKSVSRGAVLHQLKHGGSSSSTTTGRGDPAQAATAGISTSATLPCPTDAGALPGEARSAAEAAAAAAAMQAEAAEAAAAEAEAAAAAIAQQAASARSRAAEQRATEQRLHAEQQQLNLAAAQHRQRAMQTQQQQQQMLGQHRAVSSTPPRPALPRVRTKVEIEADLASPQVVTVQLYTTKGPLLIKVVPSWAPMGAARFLELIDDGYYSEIAIYRAVPDFLVQFGIIKDLQRSSRYDRIRDDPLVGVPVEEGSVVFAASGANTRKATICIFLADYPELGHSPWETPLGKVCGESLQTLHDIFTGYGDIPQCGGSGPDPLKLEDMGNSYITTNFPECDFVIGASRVLRELPFGWLECLHSEGIFYYNQDTLRASVELPDELIGRVDEPAALQEIGTAGVAADGESASVVKMQLGDWMVCEDGQGEFYWHVPTQQSFDDPPPELVQLYDLSLQEEERERRVQEQLMQLRMEQETMLERQLDQARLLGAGYTAPMGQFGHHDGPARFGGRPW
mmetsp:Transcript_51369/g.122057  ORF Transcript_51369/g.122057 Transcript_51369/m.122057 type:complete len:568 (-) Transcript_51369:62-1765(-)